MAIKANIYSYYSQVLLDRVGRPDQRRKRVDFRAQRAGVDEDDLAGARLERDAAETRMSASVQLHAPTRTIRNGTDGGEDRRHERPEVLHAIGYCSDDYDTKWEHRDGLLELDATIHCDQDVV